MIIIVLYRVYCYYFGDLFGYVDFYFKEEFDMTSLNNVHLDKEQATNTCDDLPFEVRNSKPNKELLEALKEGDDILSGKIDAKKYSSVKELIENLENGV